MKVKSILGLPLDVLRIIFDDSGLGTRDIKNVRLVHSAFRDIVCQKLFEKIYLYFDDHVDPDFGSLVTELLEAPEFGGVRSYVRTLGIFILAVDRRKTSNIVFQRFVEKHGDKLRRRLIDGSFGRLVEVELTLSSDFTPAGWPTAVQLGSGYTDISGICRVLGSLNDPVPEGEKRQDGTPSGEARVPMLSARLIRCIRPNDAWLRKCMTLLPPVECLLLEAHSNSVPHLASVIDNSPNLRVLEIMEFDEDGYYSMDGMFMKLKKPESLSRVTDLKITLGTAEDTTMLTPATMKEISRFQSLKRMQICSEGGLINFPWEVAKESNIRLETIDVSDMSEGLIEYLTWLPTDSLTSLKLDFAITAASFAATYEELEANLRLAGNFWAAVARFSSSLTKFSMRISLEGDDGGEELPGDYMDLEDDTQLQLRIDSYLAWSPSSQEFENANIRFETLENISVQTAFIPDLSLYTPRRKELLSQSGVNPCEFRFDRLMASLSKCLHRLRLITVSNMSGVYEKDYVGSDDGEDRPDYEYTDTTGAISRMIPVVENFRFDEETEASAINVGGLPLHLQPIPDGPAYERPCLFLLKDGRWKRHLPDRRTMMRGFGGHMHLGVPGVVHTTVHSIPLGGGWDYVPHPDDDDDDEDGNDDEEETDYGDALEGSPYIPGPGYVESP